MSPPPPLATVGNPAVRRAVWSWPLVVTMLCWAYNFVALKFLYPELSPPATAWWRYVAMVLVVVPICWVTGQSLRFADRNEAIRATLGGFLSMGVYMVLFIGGMAETSPAEGAVILATSPILTYLFSCLAGIERFRPWAMAGALLAFAGVATVVFGGDHGLEGTIRGDLMVLASAAIWAISLLVLRPVLANRAPMQALALTMPGGALPLLLYGGWGAWQVDPRSLSAVGWLSFCHVALLSGVLAFYCFYLGVRQIGAAGATLYQFSVPPMAALFGWWLLGQGLAPVQFLGFVAALVGVYVAQRARQ